MSKFTHGGFDKSEAYNWDKDTYLEFGEIVFKILSTDRKIRHQGSCDFHEFHRHFMKDDWDTMMNRLDEFRITKGAKPIKEILDSINSEFWKDTDFVDKSLCITKDCIPPANQVLLSTNVIDSIISPDENHNYLAFPVQLSLF